MDGNKLKLYYLTNNEWHAGFGTENVTASSKGSKLIG